jgi:hypothetical protein
LTIFVRIDFWANYSISLVHMSVLCQFHTVIINATSKLGSVSPPTLFFFKIFIDYFELFEIPYEFEY